MASKCSCNATMVGTEDAIDFVHRWVHISRNCDVDEKHRAALATVYESLTMLSPENGGRSPCRRDYNVSLITGLVEFVEVNRFPVKGTRQAFGPVEGAIGYKDRTCSIRQ